MGHRMCTEKFNVITGAYFGRDSMTRSNVTVVYNCHRWFLITSSDQLSAEKGTFTANIFMNERDSRKNEAQ